ncbi:MAG: transposase, partial [Acidimicrobiia bacterium]
MTIVGNPDAVIGGVDTHADTHVAAVVNHVGGVLGIESFSTTSNGYRQLVSWLRSHGELALVGVEGTGSYGVGVSRYLQHEGVTVVEVDRPNRQTRHRKGKSDPVDAVAAARAALSGTATGSPKARNGNVEAIRVLMIARRSAVDTRIETLNQLRHVVFTATPEIRAKFTGLSAIALVNKAAALRPREEDQVRYTTLVTIRALGHRVQYLREETKRLNRMLRPLIRQTAPTLLEVYGVGYDTAAKLLVAAGDNPERIRSEGAWARSTSHHSATNPSAPRSNVLAVRYDHWRRSKASGKRFDIARCHRRAVRTLITGERLVASVLNRRGGMDVSGCVHLGCV